MCYGCYGSRGGKGGKRGFPPGINRVVGMGRFANENHAVLPTLAPLDANGRAVECTNLIGLPREGGTKHKQ
jgi:hypothetical protein